MLVKLKNLVLWILMLTKITMKNIVIRVNGITLSMNQIYQISFWKDIKAEPTIIDTSKMITHFVFIYFHASEILKTLFMSIVIKVIPNIPIATNEVIMMLSSITKTEETHINANEISLVLLATNSYQFLVTWAGSSFFECSLAETGSFL